ncbi:uncharacterized protein LOC134247728 [Saccostrea cucullata]|uniref:uncharacterized protein LOC134247728 n=1 Tax=Saccostrea cuccullata TaxID=36930 RepID=UPI002ED1738F
MGGNLNTDVWKKPNKYIRTKAIENQWVPSNDFWVGMIKGPNSDMWYHDKYVEKCQMPTDNTTFSGQSYSNLQCAAFNMSIISSSDTSKVIYATSCDTRLGFVCRIQYGKFPEIGVEYYIGSEISRTGIQNMNQIAENSTSKESCATKAFDKTFWCFAATFDPVKEECVTECSKYPLLQNNISLVSSSNKTVLLRKHSQVLVNVRKSNNNASDATDTLHNVCIDNLLLNFTSKQASNSMERTTHVTTELQNTSQEMTSECDCLCSENQQNITAETLDKILKEIKRNLTVIKRNLSSTIRKMSSASDDRELSVTMGALGVGVIITFLTTLVLSDIVNFMNWIQNSANVKGNH